MPDARVEAAIANWAPRFVANGVYPDDFNRTTAKIETWDGWLDAWVETGDGHRARAEEAEADGNTLTAGEAFVAAAVCYHFAKFVWVVDVERNHETTRLAADCLYRAHAHLDPTAERIDGPVRGRAARRQPAASAGRRASAARAAPAGPRLDEGGVLPLGERLPRPRDGDVLLDGPGQGESGFATNIRGDYEAGVGAALDALASRDDLDHDRVGAAGVSLGGYYAPRARRSSRA